MTQATVPLHPRTAAVVLAAGTGSRAGSVLKQFRRMGQRSVLGWSVDALSRAPEIGEVVIVIGQGMESAAKEALGEVEADIVFAPGGTTRRESVFNAMQKLEETGAGSPDFVMVHDAARPGLSQSIIVRLLDPLLSGADAVIPVLPVVDTLASAAGGAVGDVVDRALLRRVQTPQAFRFSRLLNAHLGWHGPEEPTDDAQMIRATGGNLVSIEGDAALEKITLPGDHERLERCLASAPLLVSRAGLGFDVHRLEVGASLWLCGVEIPHSHGLAGHSDADVAIHALVDALLGAIAEGDIGSHFPPSDPHWRGASSDRFLAFAIERVQARGGIVDHLDVTIICEAPKIGPHREAMRARLAQITGLPISRISVKATTTERLGLTGRGEGIAAQAIASVRLPVED